MLFYYDNSFLQILEGERDAVESLFLKIARNQRHRAAMVFTRGMAEERAFGEWRMAFQALSSDEVAS